MSGLSLHRPINYSLSRIVPPPGVAIDPCKRPVVVIDPRAGQGRASAGSSQSEIGDALSAAIRLFRRLRGYAAPGQQFLDVVEGK